MAMPFLAKQLFDFPWLNDLMAWSQQSLYLQANSFHTDRKAVTTMDSYKTWNTTNEEQQNDVLS